MLLSSSFTYRACPTEIGSFHYLLKYLDSILRSCSHFVSLTPSQNHLKTKVPFESRMAQDDVDDCISALEEWYSMYTNLVERDIHTTLETMRLPPHDLAAVEDDIVQAMKDITVVDGFCSPCQTMLDSWPESVLKKRKGYIYDTENRLAKEEEKSSPETSSFSRSPSRSPSPDPSYWKQRSHGPIVELPSHEDLIGRMAASRNGCKFCSLILGSIEHQGRLESYTKIDRMLRKLGKSSHIYMTTMSVWDTSPGVYASSLYLSLSLSPSQNPIP